MNVLLINGSPHKEGCTYTALKEVADTLEKNEIKTKIFHIGAKAVMGCTGCYKCRDLKRCIFDDDVCNEMAELAAKSDGLVIGTPVYFASANGALCALLDRMFVSAGHKMFFKPGAAVVSCRRGGASAAFDRINKYFTIMQMPIVSSQYWNSVHGVVPELVKKDLEGLQIMRTLGNNMAWLLKSIEAGQTPIPQSEPRIVTSFHDGK